MHHAGNLMVIDCVWRAYNLLAQFYSTLNFFCYFKKSIFYIIATGGHINPAVSLSMALIGRLDWVLLPVYMLAQYLGAFVGAAIVYLVYYGEFTSQCV